MRVGLEKREVATRRREREFLVAPGEFVALELALGEEVLGVELL